jgi:hypothetical protein
MRLLLAVTACAAAAAVATYVAFAGDTPKSSNAIEHFHTRPDLLPPVVHVTTLKPGVEPGYVFFAPKQLEAGIPGTSASIQQGPEILDDHGQVVWFGPVPGSNTRPKDARPHATDFRVQTYRGKPVLTWWQGLSFLGHGDGAYMIYDSSYHKVAEVRPKHGVQGDEHEFTVTPRGTALITFYRPVPHQDLSSVGGPKDGTLLESGVQEIDIATGRVVFEWHSLGHVALAESYAKPDPKHPAAAFDYFHVNSAADEPNGDLLVSARNTHALYEISRKTGRIVWRLGGKRSDWKMAEGTLFAWQHDARRQPDGTITIFDNGAAPAVEKFSRVLRLRLHPKTKTVTLVRALAHPKKLLSGSQGDGQFFADGHVFVGWGANPNMTEFDAKGRVVFDAHWTKGSDSYRAFRFRWVGRPTTPPTVVASGSGQVTAWVSWNGATEVRQWRLLAGSSRSALEPVTTVGKGGFETRIRARVGGGFLAVEALDASGNVLGRSAVLVRGGAAWKG